MGGRASVDNDGSADEAGGPRTATPASIRVYGPTANIAGEITRSLANRCSIVGEESASQSDVPVVVFCQFSDAYSWRGLPMLLEPGAGGLESERSPLSSRIRRYGKLLRQVWSQRPGSVIPKLVRLLSSAFSDPRRGNLDALEVELLKLTPAEAHPALRVRIRRSEIFLRYAWSRHRRSSPWGVLRFLVSSLLIPRRTILRAFEEELLMLLPAEARSALQEAKARLVLWDHWEVIDAYGPGYAEALSQVADTLGIPASRVSISVPDFRNAWDDDFDHPQIRPYDWVFLHAKAAGVSPGAPYLSDRPSRRLLLLNRRGSPERFLCANYLYSRHPTRCYLSYLTTHHPGPSALGCPGPGLALADEERFLAALPLELDGRFGTVNQLNWVDQDGLREYLEDSLVLAGFETNHFGPTSRIQQISEKSYHGIRWGLPFMVFAAQPGLLAHLRRLGFRTFTPWIDERYDEPAAADPTTNYRLRLEHFLHELDRLCSLTDVEAAAIAAGCRESVEHNLAVLRDAAVIPPFRLY